MSKVCLQRVEGPNMRRFYTMQVQPNLFGGFAVVREWGRIGQSGTGPKPSSPPRPRRWTPWSGSAAIRSGADIRKTRRSPYKSLCLHLWR